MGSESLGNLLGLRRWNLLSLEESVEPAGTRIRIGIWV